jgi:hypothetical protein
LQHIEREQDGGRAEARRLTFNAFSLGLLSLGADVVAMMSGMRARSQPHISVSGSSDDRGKPRVISRGAFGPIGAANKFTSDEREYYLKSLGG